MEPVGPAFSPAFGPALTYGLAGAPLTYDPPVSSPDDFRLVRTPSEEPITDPAWTRLPTTYVVCTRDRTVRVEAQRACASRADEVVELDCDHSPFFSAPDALTDVLVAQVGAASAAPA